MDESQVSFIKLCNLPLQCLCRQFFDKNFNLPGFEEHELYILGEKLGNHVHIGKLGITLGFDNAQIDNYIATNYTDGKVTSKGTVNMLFNWKLKTPEVNQREEMMSALTEAGFKEEADKLEQGKSSLM